MLRRIRNRFVFIAYLRKSAFIHVLSGVKFPFVDLSLIFGPATDFTADKNWINANSRRYVQLTRA